MKKVILALMVFMVFCSSLSFALTSPSWVNIKDKTIVDPREYGARFDGTDDSVGINAAIASMSAGQTVLVATGAHVFSPIHFYGKDRHLKIGGPIYAHGCSAIKVGYPGSLGATKLTQHSTVETGDIINSAFDYTNYGIWSTEAIYCKFNIAGIHGFDKGIYLDDSNGQTSNNRWEVIRLENCSYGMYFQFSGTSQPLEANMFTGTIDQCNFGVYAAGGSGFGQFSEFNGVIDCSQDRTGVASSTTKDFYSDQSRTLLIKTAISKNANSTFGNNAMVFPNCQNAHEGYGIPINILSNSGFELDGAGNATFPFVAWNQYSNVVGSLTTRLSDGAISLVASQPGVVSNYIQQTLPPRADRYAGKLLSGRVVAKTINSSSPFIQMQIIYYTASGGPYIVASPLNQAGEEDYYYTLYNTMLVPSTSVGEVTFRIVSADNSTGTIVIKDAQLFEGVFNAAPNYTRPKPYIVSGYGYPHSGEFISGDIIMNLVATPGVPIGWTCVTGGTPGTWASMTSYP